MALQVIDFLERQYDALSPTPEGTYAVDAPVVGDGREESQVDVDLAASLALAERHAAELRRAVPHPKAIHERDAIAFWDALGLPNFTGAEIAAVHKRVHVSGVSNELPPAWGVVRLGLVGIRAQVVRTRANRAHRLTSLYRAPAYNLRIGGATHSQHAVCTAADGVLVGGTVRDLWAITAAVRGQRIVLTDGQRRAIAAYMRLKGLTSPPLTTRVGREPFNARGVAYDGAAFTNTGGRGLYLASGFVHADLRGTDVVF